LNAATSTRPTTARTRSAECRHGIPAEWCTLCTHPGAVYVTAGGTHYHSDPRCESLRDGQDAVVRRGGTPAPIERVSGSTAREDGRDPCRRCC
jgi:hypothetical protein